MSIGRRSLRVVGRKGGGVVEALAVAALVEAVGVEVGVGVGVGLETSDEIHGKAWRSDGKRGSRGTGCAVYWNVTNETRVRLLLEVTSKLLDLVHKANPKRDSSKAKPSRSCWLSHSWKANEQD